MAALDYRPISSSPASTIGDSILESRSVEVEAEMRRVRGKSAKAATDTQTSFTYSCSLVRTQPRRHCCPVYLAALAVARYANEAKWSPSEFAPFCARCSTFCSVQHVLSPLVLVLSLILTAGGHCELRSFEQGVGCFRLSLVSLSATVFRSTREPRGSIRSFPLRSLSRALHFFRQVEHADVGGDDFCQASTFEKRYKDRTVYFLLYSPPNGHGSLFFPSLSRSLYG